MIPKLPPIISCTAPGELCELHGGEMMCSHVCDEAPIETQMAHARVCDDPPPPAHPIGYDDHCIGCGQLIPKGALARLYEEGNVHADGCPERPAA